MLHTHHLGVLAAQSESEFRAEIARFAHNLGFRAADALTVMDNATASPEFFYVSSDESPDWLAIDPSYGQRDPVMQHCKTSSIPIVWGAKNYAAPGVADIHDVLASHGMRSGINVCSHLRNGRHFALALNTDRELLAAPSHVAHALPQLQLFAVHAMDAAFRLFLPAETLQTEAFSRQQVDALSWILDGKSKAEIANLLNLSEEALAIFLRTIAQDLECANEYQAALKALRLGIIY